MAASRQATAVALAISLSAFVAPVWGQSGAANGEWSYYGGDSGNTKYAPLDQINRHNVGDLEIAWRWKTANFGPLLSVPAQVHRHVAQHCCSLLDADFLLCVDQAARIDVAGVLSLQNRT